MTVCGLFILQVEENQKFSFDYNFSLIQEGNLTRLYMHFAARHFNVEKYIFLSFLHVK